MQPKFRVGDRVKYAIPTVGLGMPSVGKVVEVRTVESGETFYYVRQPNGVVQHGVREGWMTPLVEPEPAARPKWATSALADRMEDRCDEMVCLYFEAGEFVGAAVRDREDCQAVITAHGPVPPLAVAARRILIDYIDRDKPA